ncbi:DNA repair protein RecN [Phaeobacter porticola]|uniref:DNA repair protein RecN n=1 Tax=Phaeobacter porticola TaxID=1844006 RepID=A0A1L3I2N4_9RHOB|nr:DNA repair protein RecN [Phaeobacter porticola]APG46368.1 DNA repair protein RecN [Phaeobacter porticola]
MLRALDIRDILIIDHLELNFQAGLNVLTGETGAGKSILLDSLGFVLGWRGRAELVRQGAKQGEVMAEFDLTPDHPAHAVLAEAGLPTGDTLLLRRVNTAEGRKTAWVNDRRCSGEVLRALSDTLLELHGQHDDRGLLNPRGHRAMLDEFANLADMLVTVRERWTTASRARKMVSETRIALEAIRAEEDFLRHAVAELDALDPQPGEDAALDLRRRDMQSAERIRGDIQRAQSLLTGGADAALSDAQRWLEGVADQAQSALDAPIAALLRAMIELGEAQDGVARVLDGLDFNPGELEDCEERLFAIRALARKHDVLPDDLGGYADTLRQKLAAVDAGDQDLADQEAALAEAEAAYAGAADQLSAARRETAAALDAAVMAELAPLKMERAVFETRVTDAEAGPEGKDAVAFTVATNPGAPAGPLNKIASGGELSRFLLALKVCLRGETGNQTMIFDEIDRGVGGATADAVGRRLKSLADGGQVLVVTHSPQVAAQGAHHWRVQKRVVDGQTLSEVVPLDDDERVDELARMVSGDTITPEARAAARALLAG